LKESGFYETCRPKLAACSALEGGRAAAKNKCKTTRVDGIRDVEDRREWKGNEKRSIH
jgi:hypothetical protein